MGRQLAPRTLPASSRQQDSCWSLLDEAPEQDLGPRAPFRRFAIVTIVAVLVFMMFFLMKESWVECGHLPMLADTGAGR